MYVHEDLTKYHEPPTQAKYLDRAAAEVLAIYPMTGYNNIGQDIDNVYMGSFNNLTSRPRPAAASMNFDAGSGRSLGKGSNRKRARAARLANRKIKTPSRKRG